MLTAMSSSFSVIRTSACPLAAHRGGLTGKYEDLERQNLAKQTSAKKKEIGIIEAAQYYLANCIRQLRPSNPHSRIICMEHIKI